MLEYTAVRGRGRDGRGRFRRGPAQDLTVERRLATHAMTTKPPGHRPRQVAGSGDAEVDRRRSRGSRRHDCDLGLRTASRSTRSGEGGSSPSGSKRASRGRPPAAPAMDELGTRPTPRPPKKPERPDEGALQREAVWVRPYVDEAAATRSRLPKYEAWVVPRGIEVSLRQNYQSPRSRPFGRGRGDLGASIGKHSTRRSDRRALGV